jgi:hypothetical protein
MKKLLLSYVLAACSCLTPAYAHGEVLDNRDEIMAAVRAGRVGAWLDAGAVRRCLENTIAADNCRAQLDVVSEQKNILTKDVDLLKTSLTDSSTQIQLWKQQSDNKDLVINNLKEDLEAWYRNPVLVGVLGLAAGALITTAVVVAAH